MSKKTSRMTSTLNMSVFNVNDLPFSTRFVNESEVGDTKSLVMKLSSADDVDEWIHAFESTTGTHWNVRKTFPNRTKLQFRKDYVCHHSAFNKESSVGGCNKRGRSKNCLCPATMSVRIFLPSTKRKLAMDGCRGLVMLCNTHNHSTSNAEAVSLLPAPDNLRAVFEGYFFDGHGITDAMRFHRDKMEVSNCTAADLADATKNPKYRTVLHWHTVWREKNQGPRTGDGMICTLREKVESYQQIGCEVLINSDPLVIIVITPIMKRAQQTPDAAGLCFVDSTASCDANNHSVTFMLTTCAAGAVPLAVLITAGQSQADYEAAFKMLRDHNPNMFGGASQPQVFMTDDSDAERGALGAVWPASDLRLCLFHVPQANWRWLWDSNNAVKKDHRPILMAEFRTIMMALTEQDATAAFTTAMNSSTATKYPRWQKRLENYFARRESWCVAWRSAVHRGHHTNNYSEVTVRLFKDIVLARLKAYNAVSLVDFVCTAMEQYYYHRLLDFAHSRVAGPHIWLKNQLIKAAYVRAEDILQTSATTYEVPSECDIGVLYSVDVEAGVCGCHDGLCGKFCKHQAAIMKHKPGVVLPNGPPVNTESRHAMAVLALGSAAQQLSFYAPFTATMPPDDPVDNTAPAANETSGDYTAVHSCSSAPAVTDATSVTLNDSGKLMTEAIHKINDLHNMFGSSTLGWNSVVKRLNNIRTPTQWESFLHSFGGSVPIRHHQHAAIRVQPTAVGRRLPGVSRGSKRRAAGHPALSDEKRYRAKRRHNLSCNVGYNQPNAKSHGDGH